MSKIVMTQVQRALAWLEAPEQEESTYMLELALLALLLLVLAVPHQ